MGTAASGVKKWQSEAFHNSIFPDFEKRGHLAAPYLELVDSRDIGKGIANFGSGPRFSTGYVALRNRAALLVETHMLKPYAVRVRATYDLIVSTLTYLKRHPGELRKAVTQADADTIARVPGSSLPLVYRTGEQSVPFALKGYEFTQTASAISGEPWVRYDPKKPKTADRPVLPRPYRHANGAVAGGVSDPGRVAADRRQAAPARHPTSSGSTTQRRCAWNVIASVHRTGTKNRSKVVINCANSRLLPKPARAPSRPAPSSSHSTRRMRMSSSTCSSRARRTRCSAGAFSMRSSSRRKKPTRASSNDWRARCWPRTPTLQREFDAKIAADPAFAKSADARLDFFYQRSPWFTAQRVGLYPVVRLDAAALAAARQRE